METTTLRKSCSSYSPHLTRKADVPIRRCPLSFKAAFSRVGSQPSAAAGRRRSCAGATAVSTSLRSAVVDPLGVTAAAVAAIGTDSTGGTGRPSSPASVGRPALASSPPPPASPPVEEFLEAVIGSHSGATSSVSAASIPDNDRLAVAGDPPTTATKRDAAAAGSSAATVADRENPGRHRAGGGGGGGDTPGFQPPDWLQRTTLLLGYDGVARLRDTRVLVVGLGGVGSYVAEFLVRAGIGSLAIVDGDVVDVTNKNRQLPALDSTVGRPKAQVMAGRLLDINPDLNLIVRQEFLVPEGAGSRLLEEVAGALDRGRAGQLGAAARSHSSCSSSSSSSGNNGGSGDEDSGCSSAYKKSKGVGQESASVGGSSGPGNRVDGGFDALGGGCAGGSDTSGPRDYGAGVPRGGGGVSEGGAGGASGGGACAVRPLDWVVDCIDSIAPKLALVAAAHASGARVVSSMGAGGRMDPLAVRIADISETYGESFAANVRRGLRRKYGIHEGVTVAFSTEPCQRASLALTSARYKRSYYGTISFLPAMFGLQIAAHIVNTISDGPMLATEAAQRQQLRMQRDAATGGKSSSGAPKHARPKAQGTHRGTAKGIAKAAAGAGDEERRGGRQGDTGDSSTSNGSGCSGRGIRGELQQRLPANEFDASAEALTTGVRGAAGAEAVVSGGGGSPAPGRAPRRQPSRSLWEAVQSGSGVEGWGL